MMARARFRGKAAARHATASGEGVMQWWLSVFFLVNGVWLPGPAVEPGWAPRPYASETECLARKSFAERQCAQYPLDYRAEWRCTSPDPLTEPPPDLQGHEC